MKLCARLGVSQKRHGPGKIHCATILGWLVIFRYICKPKNQGKGGFRLVDIG